MPRPATSGSRSGRRLRWSVSAIVATCPTSSATRRRPSTVAPITASLSGSASGRSSASSSERLVLSSPFTAAPSVDRPSRSPPSVRTARRSSSTGAWGATGWLHRARRLTAGASRPERVLLLDSGPPIGVEGRGRGGGGGGGRGGGGGGAAGAAGGAPGAAGRGGGGAWAGGGGRQRT